MSTGSHPCRKHAGKSRVGGGNTLRVALVGLSGREPPLEFASEIAASRVSLALYKPADGAWHLPPAVLAMSVRSISKGVEEEMT